MIDTDTASIEDVRNFIADVDKKRDNWLTVAERSWLEIKKRNRNGRLWGGYDLDRVRRVVRYPLWWVTMEIRKSITLSRLPIPVLKDTQGDDPLGRTACVIGERFTKGILKTFDALSVFCSGRDDFLITNFAWCRAFLKVIEGEEEEKIRLQEIQPPPQMDPNGQPIPPQGPIFITPDGQQVAQPEFDDLGAYVSTGQMIPVYDEQVYLDHGLYSDLYVDPDARRWSQVKKLAFKYEYTYRDFSAKFGAKALEKIATKDIDDHKNGRPIVVFEYWDYFTREVKWCAENSDDFFQPSTIAVPNTHVNPPELEEVDPDDETDEADKERADSSDIYGLDNFFPCAEPLCLNAPTDEYWPIPEYFQVREILDDVHNITTRMFLLTKAIRVRFLFDGSIPELKQLVNESSEGTGLSVPNLSEALINSRDGTLAKLVAYFPVKEMIEGLGNMYTAFNQRLDMYFQATGINDLIRGAASDVEKTYGERQMEGKYALNRIEPYQRAIQEWIKNSYQILMEMGLKNFSDQTIDEYITPQTLDPEDKQRYVPALKLLKSNRRRRFRVDFETDSTININEQYQKQQAIEMGNAVTKMLEATANIAETQPELAATELAVAKHVISQYSDGKLLVDEFISSIEEVMDKMKQPKEPEFDKDRAQAGLDAQKAKDDSAFKRLQLQTQTQLEIAKLTQKSQQDQITNQLKQLEIQIQNGASQAELQVLVGRIQAEIAQGWADLNLRKEEMMQFAAAEGGKQSIEAFRAQIDARVAAKEMTLAEAGQALEAFRTQIEARDAHASLEERIATEARLQDEHKMSKEAHAAETFAKIAEVMTPEPPKAPPITIDKSTTIHLKQPEAKAKTTKDKKK